MKKKSTKWIALLLSVLLMVPVLAIPASAAGADDFKDVSKNSWYYEAVKYTFDKGIFAGTAADTFEPQTPITRAMFIKSLANLTKNFNAEDWTNLKTHFTDVSTDAWYAEESAWAYFNGLIAGTSVDTFSPNEAITREQAATILFAYAMRTGGYFNLDNLKCVTQFSDYSKISVWAVTSMIWAVEQKIMTGVGDNMLDPRGTLTRAQAAQLYKNMQGIIDDEPYVYSGDVGENLGFAFENTVNMTYGELVENLGKPVKIEIVDYGNDPYYSHQYTFGAYPDVTYVFGGLLKDQVAPDDRKPHALITTVKNVIPDMAGLPLGQAIKLTKGGLYIRCMDFFDDLDAVNPDLFEGSYYAEKYSCTFFFKGTGDVDGDSLVQIHNSIDPPPG